jgi:nitrate/nitrite-specific signal transduction histidine kinase
MSDNERWSEKRGEEILRLFKRGAEFARELLDENEKLRRQLLQLSPGAVAGGSPADATEYAGTLERLRQLEEENRDFADRYREIEEENNLLANLYVASNQLHTTLDLPEVLRIVIEVVINLVGAEVFAIYLLDESNGELRVVASEGMDEFEPQSPRIGEGPIGGALASGELFVAEQSSQVAPGTPLVSIPLAVHDAPVGVIAVYSLLEHKERFTSLDRELFRLLAGHAATALFAARLHSQSERKLHTIQGFIKLLTK